MRPTESLARTSGFPNTAGPCRLRRAPAGSRWLPTLSLQSLHRRLGPYPAVSFGCSYSFLPRRHRPRLRRNTLGTRDDPGYAASTGGRISGLDPFSDVQAPMLVRPPGRTYRCDFSQGSQAVYTTHRPGWFPIPGCGITTRPLRATDAAGLSPAGLQPCRLLIPPSSRASSIAGLLLHRLQE
jgi:hypothetical protein